jgi:RNA polymerase sigma-70 factor (ECF subfamily)
MMSIAQQQAATDEELAARGDLVALHAQYGRRLIAFVAGQGSTEPEDVAQEVWSRVWKQISSGCPFEGHFRGWLFSIARNLVIDRARAKRTERLAERVELPTSTHDPVEALIQSEELQQLRRCMEKLPRQQAEALRRKLGGDRPTEIAASLQVAVDRVYRLVHHAKNLLQECLKRGAR